MSRTFELQEPLHARLLPMAGLRGLAVTLVFLQHYMVQCQLIGLSAGPASAMAAAFRNYGNFGVELFFVLSGYLIYGTLVRKAPPFFRFMARRLQRIYPAFLVVFAFALALIILTPMQNKIPHDPWLGAVYLAANLALLPGLIPMVRIVDVAWSLSYEMFFYVVTAGLVLVTGLNKTVPSRRMAILALLTSAFILASFAGISNFPARMLPFFAGMLLGRWAGQSNTGLVGLGSAGRRLRSIRDARPALGRRNHSDGCVFVALCRLLPRCGPCINVDYLCAVAVARKHEL
jgi:exopolysaccharide production protein ExoZ